MARDIIQEARARSEAPKLGRETLAGVSRCPHCGIANPQLLSVWKSGGFVQPSNGATGSYWNAFRCTTCGGVVLAKGVPAQASEHAEVAEIFPAPKAAHEDIPEIPRRFLQQAYETLHAPDAAAMVAGSAVDAMLKHLEYVEGSLYARIDKALQDNVITKGMAEWAHSVRLGSNRPRHADKENPHVSPEEAQRSVEFAEALANFLFVLTAKINRGIDAAKEAAEHAKS
jgi:hypothetical protein